MYNCGMTYDVKQIRIELDMTQQQLADALAMNNNTVSRWETGKVVIPRRMQIALDMLKASRSKPDATQ
jgi:DNA-binding transcriptional regulator YiaG